jgi:hypothetical protein
VFPRVNAKDLQSQIRLIEEQYRRFYPLIQYSCLKKAVTPSAPTLTGDRLVVGKAGTTKFDPVWGESVDSAAVEWSQPHATAGTVPAADVELYHTPVPINARVQRINKETQLKKYGFDKVRDLTLFIPLSLLDRAAITVKNGDLFDWNAHSYTVIEQNTNGYWKNTDLSLYMVMNCEQRRRGG